MRLRRLMIVTLLAATCALVPLAASAGTYTVKAVGDEWSPATRKVVKNDRVTWRNPTRRTHDVTSMGRNWDLQVMLEPGEEVAKRFRRTGRYRYRCTLHSAIVDGRCQGMCGVVVVRRP